MNDLTPECYAIIDYMIEKMNAYNKKVSFYKQISVTIKRIHKLLYFCDIIYMKLNNGIPMFEDEFCAWPSGPAIPRIYEKYKDGFGWFDIKSLHKFEQDSLTDEAKRIIGFVLEITKQIDTLDLEDFCCKVGSPWYNVFDKDDIKYDHIISKEEMYRFYSNENFYNKKVKMK